MAEYTLKYINHRAEHDAEAFVHDCEVGYHRQLHLVADQIAANCKRKPVVLLNGPSSSGKTTTNDRLGRILELAGIHAHMISMDDYYRTSGTYDIPFDEENGVNDLESPECMDLDLLRARLTDPLLNGSTITFLNQEANAAMVLGTRSFRQFGLVNHVVGFAICRHPA